MGDGIVFQHPKGDILRLTDVAPSGRFADQNIDKEAQTPRLGERCEADSQGKPHSSNGNGADSGADLQRVIDAWPRLLESTRQAILKLLDE